MHAVYPRPHWGSRGNRASAVRYRDDGPVFSSVVLILLYTVRMAPTTAHHRQQVTGLWIAFADDRETILGRGKTPEEALKKAQKTCPETLIITHVPPEDNEIPNESLLAAIQEADEYMKSGKRTVYRTVDEVMTALR
jgi:predicted RNase H-like HicB family nuclease